MNIRKSNINDLNQIVEIYNQAIATKTATADTEPLETSARMQWYQEHHPDKYPIFVAEIDNHVVGWISLSPYRSGRAALRFTAEVSYYIHDGYKRRGIASRLLDYVISVCPDYEIKTIFAIILEHNLASIYLMEKYFFEKWAYLPKVADFDGVEYGHVYYGLRVSDD